MSQRSSNNWLLIGMVLALPVFMSVKAMSTPAPVSNASATDFDESLAREVQDGKIAAAELFEDRELLLREQRNDLLVIRHQITVQAPRLSDKDLSRLENAYQSLQRLHIRTLEENDQLALDQDHQEFSAEALKIKSQLKPQKTSQK